MSVLIKGLNIKPCKDGFDGKGLVIIGYDDELYFVAHEQIIPLQDHGDLIGCDEYRIRKRLVYRGEVYNALEAERVNSLDGILTDPYEDGFHDGLKRALQILAEVEDAPTIIEAEEE